MVNSSVLVVLVGLVLAAAPAGGSAGPGGTSNATDADVQRPCIEMLEAWYGGDGDQMARVLHDDLAKRGVLKDPKTGRTVLRFANKTQMLEGARTGLGRIPRNEWDIHAHTLDRGEEMATVKVVSAYLIDVCQVARVEDRWLVVNVLWTMRRTPPWF